MKGNRQSMVSSQSPLEENVVYCLGERSRIRRKVGPQDPSYGDRRGKKGTGGHPRGVEGVTQRESYMNKGKNKQNLEGTGWGQSKRRLREPPETAAKRLQKWRPKPYAEQRKERRRTGGRGRKTEL